MLINLTAISTGFWKEGEGRKEGRKDRLGLRSDDGDLVVCRFNSLRRADIVILSTTTTGILICSWS